MKSKNNIIGIVPAAGSGTRLYPYSGAKELLPIGSQKIKINGRIEERPKIVSQYVIDAMITAGVEKIIIIINECKINLMKLYKNGQHLGVDICYIFQDKSLGMAYALNLAKNWVKNATVLMGMPDTVVLPDNCFIQLLSMHRKHNAELSLGLFPTDKPHKGGMTKYNNKNDIIYHKDKPAKTDATDTWGIVCWEYIFTQKLASFLNKNDLISNEVVLGDIFDVMIAEGYNCKAFPINNGKYYDVGTYDDFKKAVSSLN